jgi:hypothetical protein
VGTGFSVATGVGVTTGRYWALVGATVGVDIPPHPTVNNSRLAMSCFLCIVPCCSYGYYIYLSGDGWVGASAAQRSECPPIAPLHPPPASLNLKTDLRMRSVGLDCSPADARSAAVGWKRLLGHSKIQRNAIYPTALFQSQAIGGYKVLPFSYRRVVSSWGEFQ